MKYTFRKSILMLLPLIVVFTFFSCEKKITEFVDPNGVPGSLSFTFSPSSGSVGTLVTLTFTESVTPTAMNLGGVTLLPLSTNGTEVKALVMPGSVTGDINVTVDSSTSKSSSQFTVISSAAPVTQQGSKLVGTGYSGAPFQGYSIALSSDGNTLAVGGYDDASSKGAVWVYTRSGSTWTQQGAKITATGTSTYPYQGSSVSLSADGNTLAVGGYYENSIGAVWVYTRNGGVWTQQGAKLVGTGYVGTPYQGTTISLSADGNTLAVGAYGDNSGVGAVWVFVRSAGVWSQQGSKLVGTGATGSAYQGYSVSISADGNTLVSGGPLDSSNKGAAWIFTRSAGVWSQQGSKLVGTGGTSSAYQGFSVSLNADGNTMAVGGYNDNTSVGAVWIFTRSGSTWSQQGSKLVGTGGGATPTLGYCVSLSASGDTLVAGAPNEGADGAAWVFTRSGGTWSQQGSKRLGTGGVSGAFMGTAISISADGNTMAVGGYWDNSGVGAGWVFAP